MIQLQFSRSTELVSYMIARACRSPFSHVDIVLPDGNLLGASDSAKGAIYRRKSWWGGYQASGLSAFRYQATGLINCSAKVEKAFLEAARSQLGEPFDSSAMHAVFSGGFFAVDRDWRDQSAWFCSELKSWCLEEAGFFPYQLLISKNRVTPPDLLLMVNPWVINAETFWEPIPGLPRGPLET